MTWSSSQWCVCWLRCGLGTELKSAGISYSTEWYLEGDTGETLNEYGPKPSYMSCIDVPVHVFVSSVIFNTTKTIIYKATSTNTSPSTLSITVKYVIVSYIINKAVFFQKKNQSNYVSCSHLNKLQYVFSMFLQTCLFHFKFPFYM